jgi:hypothetical protein
MNDEDYYNQYIARRPLQNKFESPEAISKHLLEVDEYENETVSKDSARANLNPNEMKFVRANGGLLLEVMEGEELCGWDLSVLRKKFYGKQGNINVTSRSKDGWASVLAKTDKQISVQEMKEITENVSENFNEETQQGLFSRIIKGKKVPGA